jgi:hypothetical protein
VILPALSKSSALGFLLNFSEGGVPGRGIEQGTAVQQSSALSTKPRCTHVLILCFKKSYFS